MIASQQSPENLSETQIRDVIERGLGDTVAGKRVLFLIPDGTRTAPLPLMFRLIQETLAAQARKLDFLIALGTHQPMPEADIERRIGVSADERAERYPKTTLFNHRWDDPSALRTLGAIPAEEIAAISEGRLEIEVPVTVNAAIFDYDLLVVCGPVYPHEVVGFSGGNKYFFPGIAGPQVIDVTHWLGALMTSMAIIGREDTPVRRVIDRAASLIKLPKLCLSMVTRGEGLVGLYLGTPEESQRAAAELSAQLHVQYLDRPYERVLAILPEMYDDIWTAAKGMYKTEPIVADGGEVILYAPHIRELSRTHGRILEQIGYHTRDYFVHQWNHFKEFPWGVLAHSTHLRGAGSFENGVERPRIQVALATGIPEERCRAVGLGYVDPRSILLSEWEGREGEGILVVKHAGETLFRLRENSREGEGDEREGL